MKRLIALCVAGCVAMALVACGSAGISEETFPAAETTPAPTPTPISNATPESTNDSAEKLFDSNETINSFLIKYNKIAEYPFEADEIEKGSVRNKAIVSTDELYITIYDLNNGIHVSIEDRNEPWDGFFPTFRDFLKSIDDSITDEQAASCWESLQCDEYRVNINNTGIDTPYMVNEIQTGYLHSSIYGEISRAEILYIE